MPTTGKPDEFGKEFWNGIVRNIFALIFLGFAYLYRLNNPKGISLDIQKNYESITEFGSSMLHHEYVYKAIGYNQYLESATFKGLNFFVIPPISILDFCGSILCCISYRQNIKSQKSWFESLVSCTLMQFGGTTLTGLLLGQTPSWILSHSAFPALFLAWYLIFFCPMDIFFKVINYSSSAVFFIGLVAAASSGHAVTSWGVDKAAFNTFHVNYERISQSTLVCIGCGILSGSGGGLLADALRFFSSDKSYTFSVTPSIFTPGNYKASATVNKSFYLALIYILLLNQNFYCPWAYQAQPGFARLVIVVISVLNYILQSLYSIDIFQNLSTLYLHKVFFITPLVGPVNIEEKKEEVGKEEEKEVDIDENDIQGEDINEIEKKE